MLNLCKPTGDKQTENVVACSIVGSCNISAAVAARHEFPAVVTEGTSIGDEVNVPHLDSRSQATPCGDTAPLGASVLRGNTALHYAAYYGHGTTVGLLLKHKADIEAQDNDGPGAQGGREELFGHGAVDSPRCVCGAVWLDFLGAKLGGASSAEMKRSSESVQRTCFTVITHVLL